MKKGIIIGILAIAAIVIAGCTQVRESQVRPVQGATYQGVLDMLEACTITGVVGQESSTCVDVCNSQGKTCTGASFHHTTDWDGYYLRTECNGEIGYPGYECVCCAPLPL